MAIKYDKKLNYEIKKTISNFNRKVRRLQSQERQFTPSQLTKAELTKDIRNRRELERKLNELKRFNKRGSEEIVTTKGGIKLTRYELENLKRKSARAKYNLTREINRLSTTKPTVFGRKQDVTFAEMGDTRYLNSVTRRDALRKNINTLTKEEFEKYKGLVNKTIQYQDYERSTFKDNYFKMIEDLGYFYSYNSDKLETIKKKLYSLDSEKFLKLFNTDKSIKAITDYYPIMTGRKTGIKPIDIESDVVTLFNNLYDNIDKIVANYE